MSNSLVIYGAGGQSRVVIDIAYSQGYRIEYIVDEMNIINSNYYYDIKVLKSIKNIKNIKEFSYALAIGDNYVRNKIYNMISNKYGNLDYPAIYHPSSFVSKFAKIGSGTIVMPLSVIGSFTTVKKFCILNTKCSIDHDCVMENFSSLGPAATIGGNVTIGKCTAVCIGAIVKNSVKISSNSVLGANSYLNKNLPSNVIAYGSPASIIRKRKKDEEYLS